MGVTEGWKKGNIIVLSYHKLFRPGVQKENKGANRLESLTDIQGHSYIPKEHQKKQNKKTQWRILLM